jgi:hypothetical protein
MCYIPGGLKSCALRRTKKEVKEGIQKLDMKLLTAWTKKTAIILVALCNQLLS